MRAIPQREPLFLGGSIGGVPSFDLNFARLDNPVTKYGFVFTRATSATYVNSTGLIATAASGELRYTYDPVTLSALGVLIEEARTNLLLYSQAFDAATAYWGLVNAAAVTANTVQSPSGSTDAEDLVETAFAGSRMSCSRTSFLGGGTGAHTLSFYVKRRPGSLVRHVRLLLGDAALSNYAQAFINVDTGAINSASAAGASPPTGVSGGAQLLSGGWVRVWVTGTFATTVSYASLWCTDAAFLTSYTGDTSSGFHVWGAQVEAGAFPTSYIPTAGAAATRNADVLSLTGAAGRTNLIVGSAAPITQNVTVTAVPYTLSQTGSGTITLSGASTAGPLVGAGSLTFTPSAGTLTLTMSGSPAEVQLETGSTATTYIPTTSGPRTVENVASWFSGDAGTWVIELIGLSAASASTIPAILCVGMGTTSSNEDTLFVNSSKRIGCDARSGGTTVWSLPQSATPGDGAGISVAHAYAVDDAAVSYSGAAAVTDTSCPLPFRLDRVSIGSFVARGTSGYGYLNSTISRIRYYNSRIPDDDLLLLSNGVDLSTPLKGGRARKRLVYIVKQDDDLDSLIESLSQESVRDYL